MFNDENTNFHGNSDAGSSEETESNSGRNLPLIIRQVGGALESVMSDLNNYTDDKYPIQRVSEIAIARMVQRNPDLNNENDISKLVDMFSFHGVEGAARNTLNELLKHNSVDDIHIAFEYLYEMGLRGQGSTASSGDPEYDVLLLTVTLQKLEDMADAGRKVHSADKLLAMEWDVRESPDVKDYGDLNFGYDEDEDEE
jgi:hypothetical protein